MLLHGKTDQIICWTHCINFRLSIREWLLSKVHYTKWFYVVTQTWENRVSYWDFAKMNFEHILVPHLVSNILRFEWYGNRSQVDEGLERFYFLLSKTRANRETFKYHMTFFLAIVDPSPYMMVFWRFLPTNPPAKPNDVFNQPPPPHIYRK